MTLKLAPNVSVLPVVTSLDVPTERVLNAALQTKLKSAVIIGVDENGELYFCSSMADGGEVLWWMEKAKLVLLGVK